MVVDLFFDIRILDRYNISDTAESLQEFEIRLHESLDQTATSDKTIRFEDWAIQFTQSLVS